MQMELVGEIVTGTGEKVQSEKARADGF